MPKTEVLKNMKLAILILPIIAIVAVSGCTTGTTIVTGNGIIIEEFKPTLTDVYSQDPVGLMLKIENRGEAKAEDIEALIFNINIDDWDVSDEEKDLNDLLGVDPFTSTPGGTKTVYWSDMEAPELAASLEHTYTPKVRVSYDYSTSAEKPITIVDRDELISIIQQGDSLPTGTTTCTAGPLSVDIMTGDYVASPDTSGDDPFNLHIYITNLLYGSQGKVVEGDFGDSEDQYPLEMKITLPDELDFTSDSPDECSESWTAISMWDAHDTEITCQLQVEEGPEIMTEGLIKVDIRYRFAIDASTTIKVTGI